MLSFQCGGATWASGKKGGGGGVFFGVLLNEGEINF